jgi:acetyltransferase-like isoleucine patch superfamily enzyme
MIKKVLLSLCSFLNNIILANVVTTKNTRFIFSWIRIDKANIINTKDSIFIKSNLHISGKNNKINIFNSKISNAHIRIKGNNNTLEFEDGFELRRGTIILMGINCSIRIKKNTIINGIRIVNVGVDNNIEIGESCLFSDNIEIYASDTHSIYNANGEFINQERPVIINDHVWVGAHVKIVKGVTVGEGAVIGMASLITKDVSERTLVAGNPPHIIKENIEWKLDYESTRRAGLAIYD